MDPCTASDPRIGTQPDSGLSASRIPGSKHNLNPVQNSISSRLDISPTDSANGLMRIISVPRLLYVSHFARSEHRSCLTLLAALDARAWGTTPRCFGGYRPCQILTSWPPPCTRFTPSGQLSRSSLGIRSPMATSSMVWSTPYNSNGECSEPQQVAPHCGAFSLRREEAPTV
ncbi:hypothetical protein BC827DRAFT_97098 [Russula dissimulans]|nr:hypothetical protein BC827DRAFT_97098 [Russula dissimulans]